MIGREPTNERQRRAEDRAREQLEDPQSPNVQLIPLQDGRILIRELDEDGILIRETFAFIDRKG